MPSNVCQIINYVSCDERLIVLLLYISILCVLFLFVCILYFVFNVLD